ncbi:MAG: molecular chaperone HtpG [Candidatus Lokiarchaeota archaeon]|nr:molecular chaperone HtpG [Candidatus Lokiarchaeota archaeon]MBD3200379.1 molecular chaperone HtpG [Candidatus Lokiarchaeota archaeon]
MSEQEYEFQAEIRKLLNILSKSLYQHKEIFLRELISNAVDASKKIDFILLTDRDIRDADEELRIEIYFNPEEKTLTIRDYGVGMTKNELINDLGTIAGSGTEKFLKKLEESKDEEGKKIDLDIIGQFGIGFYSVFMVTKEAKVRTKSYANDEDAYEWTSDGTGKFKIQTIEKQKRGTDIILYLNDEDEDFLNEFRIENIVKKYSNFVPYPIYVYELEEGDSPETGKIKPKPEPEDTEEEAAEGEEESLKEERVPEPINETTPLWKKNKNDITEEDYKDFYHYISNRYDDYLDVINYKVDGRVRFRSILFIPSSPSQDMLQPETDYGLSLYSRSVLIMKYAKDLIPQWMRFVKGILESEDIPLNISRETIQTNREIMKMSNLIVKKFIRELNILAENDSEKFMEIWENFGQFIKEGIVTDIARKEKLKKLLRFRTSKTKDDELIGLDEYVERMKDNQEKIFYLVGEDLETLKMSPHLGYYEENDLEVILFDETIDNFLMMNLNHYEVEEKPSEGEEIEEGEEGKKKTKFIRFSPIDVAETEEKEEGKEDKEKEEEKKEEIPEKVKNFLEYIEKVLEDKIIKAKTSQRLYGNPCRLANPAEGPSSSQQRAMRYWTQTLAGQEFNIPKKIFEINPNHPTIKSLIQLYEQDAENKVLKPIILQLFENSLLSEGDLPNPSSMVPRINQIIEMLLTEGSNTEE